MAIIIISVHKCITILCHDLLGWPSIDFIASLASGYMEIA